MSRTVYNFVSSALLIIAFVAFCQYFAVEETQKKICFSLVLVCPLAGIAIAAFTPRNAPSGQPYTRTLYLLHLSFFLFVLTMIALFFYLYVTTQGA